MTDACELLVLKKRIKYLFIVMKRLDVLNQHKIIKFIEKHILTFKKSFKNWKKSRLRRNINKKTLKIVTSNTKNIENLYIEKDKNDESNESILASPECGSYVENDFHSNIPKTNTKIECDLEIESNDNSCNLTDEYEKVLINNHTANENEQEFETDNPNTEVKNRKHGCSICKETFSSHNLLINHISKHEGTPQSCVKCKACFENATFFKFHLSKNSLVPCLKCEKENFKNITIDELLFCPYCGRKYSTTFNLRRHVQICDFLPANCKINSSENIYTCNLCSWQSQSKDEYGKHYLKHAKNQCLECDISFPSRKLLREHNTKHKKTVSSKYFCEVCRISFINRRLYREHVKLFKNDLKHVETKLHDKSVNKIWCMPCQQSFIDEKTYKRHCSRQNHLKTCKLDISNMKSFICDKCGLTLKNKERLTDHISSMHKSKETLMCEFCPYSTTKSSNMIRHRQVHHKNTPKEHACDKCPALFSTLSGLKDHIKSVHSNIRPHSCNLCNKTFKLQSQLNRHKAIHNPILAYSCMYCAMGFRRRSYLKRHVISKHEEYMQNNMNILEFKTNKKPKTLQPRTTASQLPNMQDDQMYPLIDVQSGELVLLSVKDISKNNVINMATENDLLNGVHMPDTWTSSENGLYCMDPILESDRNPQQTFILPPNDDIAHSIAEVQPDYVHFAQPNNKDIEILSNGFGIVKENVLAQNSINPELIVTDPGCNNCLNFCTMVME